MNKSPSAPLAHTAYLAFGANLNDPPAQFAQAATLLSQTAGVRIVHRSSLYRSPAWGTTTSQPDYINAVVEVATTLDPFALLQVMHSVEQTLGRVRMAGQRNAARTMDIDLLLFGERRINSPTLAIPHPRMHERAFVLLPLLEIAPHISLPGLGLAQNLRSQLPPQTIERLSPTPPWN